MACSSENQWLDTALNLAGDNRAELQKVLDRYKEEDVTNIVLLVF